MAHFVKRIARGSSVTLASYAGPPGELTMDTTTNDLVLQTGQAGGVRLAKASTPFAAVNGVEITAGGTVGLGATVSGINASVSARGVVQLSNATDSASQTHAATPKAVSDALQAAKDYADTAGAPYTGTAPIAVDASTRTISATDATTAAKGVVQVGDNVTVASGVVSVKPWGTYEADHNDVDVSTIQDGCFVQTAEPIGLPTAVLAEIEQRLSGSASAVPSSAAVSLGKYDLCEFYYFRNPKLRPGFVEAAGGLIANAAARYPMAWAYLQTTDGQALCLTEAQWQAMSTATWATLADGTPVGWEGIGGVPYFVQDLSVGTLRLPDVRGMHIEARGALSVGEAGGDATREIEGEFLSDWTDQSPSFAPTGVFTTAGLFTPKNAILLQSGSADKIVHFQVSRVVPTAPVVRPKSFGVLACVYLGI